MGPNEELRGVFGGTSSGVADGADCLPFSSFVVVAEVLVPLAFSPLGFPPPGSVKVFAIVGLVSRLG